MAIDPIAAALDAIAAHFHGLAHEGRTLTGRRGWPEHPVNLDFSAGPLLTATEGPVRAERCSPRAVDKAAADGEVEVTYRIGWLTIEGQIDLWAPYRAIRDDFAALVEARAVNRLPRSPDLWLTSTGYHGRPLTVVLLETRGEGDGDQVARGEWRKTWRMHVKTDLVAKATHPQLLENAFRVVATHLGVEVTEPTVTVTP